MMNGYKIFSRIYLFLTLIFVITLGIVIYTVYRQTDSIVKDLTESRVLTAKQGLQNYLNELQQNALQSAELIASRELFKNSIKNGNYPDLIENLKDYSHGIDFISICNPNGRILVKTYTDSFEGDTFSDNISGQQNIAAVLRTGNRSSSISFLPDGTLVTGASVPIYDNEKLIGIVSCNYDLSENVYLDIFKERSGYEAAIFLGIELLATTLKLSDGSRSTGETASELYIQNVFRNGEDFLGIIKMYDGVYGVHYSPLKSGNEIIGMLCVGTSITSTVADQRVMYSWMTIASAITFCVLIAFMVVSNRHTKIMEKLSKKTAQLSTTEKLLQSMDSLIVITEIESDKIIFLNESIKKDFKLTDSVIGQRCWEVLVEGGTDRCEFCPKLNPDFALRNSVSWEFHSPITKKHYRITSRYIDWPDGTKVFMEQSDDITELKDSIDKIEMAREELRNARDAAEAANNSKTIFLANMSHEIRTPLNSILGFSDLAQDSSLPPKTSDYLAKISENAGWLLQIINDILDISKIESGKLRLENIPFDLHDVFSRCQAAIMPRVDEKGIALYCYAEPSIGKKLLGDPLRLRQIITNLLSNAVKFTNIGTVKLLASIQESTETSSTIHFEVKDSGIGIEPDKIDKILESFVQADDSITRKYGGTGLGLPITKNILEMMGGKLEVESAPGIGSKFSFNLTFDVLKDDTGLPSKKIQINNLEKPNFEGEILVCEDNSMNQQVICEYLARVGIKATIAQNGKEGVEYVTSRMQNNIKPFDLIFMDIHMPVMDGLDAASRITALGTKTPIVAMTANIMSNDLVYYRESGMPDCVNKPFTAQELWKCLLKYLTPVSVSTEDNRHQSMNDEKLQMYLKTDFVKSNQTSIEQIKDAIDSSDIKLAHRLIHTIKSSAALISKKNLQKAAADAEKALVNGKNLLTETQMNLLETELKYVLDELAPLLKEAEARLKTEAPDKARTHELIEQLEQMLNSRNPECINLLDDIRMIPGTEELARQIEDYEFKQAINSLLEIKKGLENNG